MKHKRTRSGLERYLNDAGIPDHDRKSNGGRCADGSAYGSFLRKHDPTLFDVLFREWENGDLGGEQ